ncbi:hypothetical protein JCM10914A_39360 [Paenibacillus sp. JCM 10914]|nr:hypothetical protein JCM10914_713 [Paenibacillus sp. JCM 10914]
MCKVIITTEEQRHCLPPEAKEIRKLGGLLLEQGYRLSCQTRVTGNLTVSIPEDPLKAAIRKQLEAARNKTDHDDFI